MLNEKHFDINSGYMGIDYEEVSNKGKLDEKKLLLALQADYQSCKIYSKNRMTQIHQWRREFRGEPYGNEVKGKSRFVSKEIKKYASWLQASVLDPFVSTPDIVKCYPTNPQSTRAAIGTELILNYQFCRKFNRFDFMSQALNLLFEDGTIVVKTGWEYKTMVRPFKEQIKQDLINPETGEPILDEFGAKISQVIDEIEFEQEIPIANNPTAEICRNEDIFIDPTCLGNFDKARFVIHRFLSDLSTLKQDGRYMNLDKIKFTTRDGEYYRDENFEFNDKARRQFIVYEYWGYYDINGDDIAESIVCAWVDDVCIRLEENPYPDKKPPFIITPFLPKAFDIYGESISDDLSFNQKIKTGITRGIIDNMAMSNNAQIIIRKGELDEVNKQRMLMGESFEVNGYPNQAVMTGNYNQLPPSVFNILQTIDYESSALVGVNLFQHQTTNRLAEDNSSRGVLDGANLRKLQIARNVGENLVKPLLRKWIEYNSVLLDDETIIRVNGNYFDKVKRDDLYGQMDIDLAISTNEDNAIRIQSIGMLLQTIGPNDDPEFRRMLMAELMRLHKMPELAIRMENYEPKPDPLLEAQRQLEIEKLKAEIQELQANAQKIQSDSILKQSKANAEDARAKNTMANTDYRNLEYIRKQQGIEELAKLNELQTQLDYKDRQEKRKQDAQLARDMIKAEYEKYKADKASRTAIQKSLIDLGKNDINQKSPSSQTAPKKDEPKNDVKYRSSPKTED